MLNFAQYLQESDYISYGSYNLQHKFDYYNHLLFGNKIPPCPIMWDGDKGHLKRANGVTYCHIQDGRFVPGSLSIHIATQFKKTEQSLDAVVIHEMIHAFMDSNGRPKEGHGIFFQMKARECEQATGIHISIKDDISMLELMDDETSLCTVVLLRQQQGSHTWFAAFMSGTALDAPSKLASAAAALGARTSFSLGSDIYILKVETNLSKKYNLVRTFDTLKGVSDAEADALLQHGKIIQRIEAQSVEKSAAAELAQPKQALAVLVNDPHRPERFEVSIYSPSIVRDKTKWADFMLRWQARTYAGRFARILVVNSPLVTSKGWTLSRDQKSGSYYTITGSEVQTLLSGSTPIHDIVGA